MFITTRQLNAALSAIKISYSPGDTEKEKSYTEFIQEALEAAIEKCLKRKVSGLEIPELKTAEYIIKIAQIHDEEIKKSCERRR